MAGSSVTGDFSEDLDSMVSGCPDDIDEYDSRQDDEEEDSRSQEEDEED
jgi:hypothetical protein